MQQRFTKHILSLLNVFDEAGNPFLDESPNLITLDTKNILIRKPLRHSKTLNELGRAMPQVRRRTLED